jgi:hypothetical protein
MPSVIERSKFLMDLLSEADSFEAVYEPRDPIDSGETPVGTLGPWLMRVYSLSRYYTKQARILCIEREYEEVEEIVQDTEISVLKYKSELLGEVFWAAVRSEFDLWNAPNIGVRQGFTIIRSEKKLDDGDGFRKFLTRMLGH